MSEDDSIVSTKGGVRELKYGNSDYEVVETGRNTFKGGVGEAATGRNTYLAARQAKGSKYGSLIIRIRGDLALQQNNSRYNPRPGDQNKWMSRRVGKLDIERQLYDLRLGQGGTGEAEEAWINFPGERGRYPNTFIKVLSEISGWEWDRIDTVQFMSEPER